MTHSSAGRHPSRRPAHFFASAPRMLRTEEARRRVAERLPLVAFTPARPTVEAEAQPRRAT
jgi:hypothetical protein